MGNCEKNGEESKLKIVIVTLWTTFSVLLGMKLSGHRELSWSVVLAPLWVPVVVVGGTLTVLLVVTLVEAKLIERRGKG